MKIRDVKRMKKLLCVLLAGTVILGEAGSASSVLAAETEIGTELATEQEAVGGTETEADEQGAEAAAGDVTGAVEADEMTGTEAQSTEATGETETGEPGKTEDVTEASERSEKVEESVTESTETAEETGTEDATEATGGTETEETEAAEETETEDATEATGGTETEETETEDVTEATEGTETEETEEAEGTETEETEEAEETETEDTELSEKKVTKDEDGLKKEDLTPGTSYDDALEIALNSSVTATIQKNLMTTQREHWYKFTVTKPGMVYVSFQHEKLDSAVNDTAWEIGVDAGKSGTATVTKNSKANDTFVKTAPLGFAAGTYYIKVSGKAITSAGDSYVMTLNYEEGECELEANNSLATANELAAGTTINGSIYGIKDVADCYHVKTTEAGYLQISFSHDMISGRETAEVYSVSVQDKDGNSLMTKTSKGGEVSVVTPKLGLPAGDYYVQVALALDLTSVTGTNDFSNIFETAYQLKADFTASSSWEQESNDSYSAANIFNGSGQTYSGTIHKSGDVDYYRVEMKNAGYLQASLSHDVIAGKETTDVYNISVLDKNGNSIMTKTSKGGEANINTPKLGVAAGTYYIQIAKAIDLTDLTDTSASDKIYQTVYQLKATFKASSTWEQESNDNYSTANVITSGQKYSGSIHKNGDADYYKIEMKNAGYLQAKLTHDNVNNADVILKLIVYNADYDQVGETLSSRGSETSVKTSKIGLAAGTYYIAVKDNSTELYQTNFLGNYGLTVTTKAAAGWETEPNETSSTADSLTVGKTISGVSQTTGDYDWFRFTLSKSAYINFSLTHSKIEADDMAWYVTLMDKNGNRYSYKEPGYIYVYGATTYTESTPVKLDAGTYYIRVQAGSNAGVGKEYKLAVNKVTAAKPKITSVKSTAYNKLKVSWNRVPGAEKYYIYRSTSKNGTYEKVKTIQSGTTASWTDSTVTTGKTYYYKLKAVVTTNKTSTTSASAAKSGKAVPAAATLKASAGSKKVKLTWSKVTGASGYEIYRSTSKKGTYKKVKSITKGSTKSYTNSSLTKGKTYYYKIRAYRTVNGKKVYGSYSEVVSATVK